MARNSAPYFAASTFLACSMLTGRSATPRNGVNIDPRLGVAQGIPASFAAASNPLAIFCAPLRHLRIGLVALEDAQRREPAAVATGFPDSVPAWNTSPSGASRAITSARPPNAPIGSPPR